jgi:hypothetical protein
MQKNLIIFLDILETYNNLVKLYFTQVKYLFV